MRIIGGTYGERTADPPTEQLFGSGLRAAAALSGVIRPELTTCLDGALYSHAQGVAQTYGVEMVVKDREQPVVFSYYTPLSTPDVHGSSQGRCHIKSDDAGTSALVFGMVEADCTVTASAIVYDPQGSQNTNIDRRHFKTERFAVVGNIHEITTLGRSASNHFPSATQAARRIAHETAAEVVIVKRGALGCLVLEADGHTTAIGPYKTETVWPIGSGDVFSAVFAWAWLEDKQEPTMAATLASAATSVWCRTQTLPIPLAPSIIAASLFPGIALVPEEEDVPVYLAGPFFGVAERWLVNLTREALTHLGARVFSPLHDVGRGGDEVAARDLEGLVAARSVLGLLDGADAGTMFELGYASARGIPTVGYAAVPEREDYTMARGLATPIVSDLTSAVYQAIWSGMRPQ